MEKYKDPALPVDERVEDLLSRMTLEEKAAQLCGNLAVSFMEDGKVDMDALREQFSDGQGRFTQYSLVGIADPMVIAEVTNQLQHFLSRRRGWEYRLHCNPRTSAGIRRQAGRFSRRC